MNNGRQTSTSTIAITALQNVETRDSTRNCVIRLPRVAPIVFLIPTSFALFSYLAVAIFIKLI
ncbi:MAG TPA: hypothetical protein VGC08_01225, partial [Pedobacter sp.]